MKSVHVTVNLYSLDELSEKAREKAIEEHRRFLLDVMQPEDFISGDPVVESIESNDYLFFGDGELANCTSYYDGKTFLRVFGASFEVA